MDTSLTPSSYAPAARRTQSISRMWLKHLPGYLFLLPAVILFAVFAWQPIIQGIMFSFQNVQLRGGSDWVGLDNYRRMLADPIFGVSWKNSVEFTIISLMIGFALPIVVAVFVSEMRFAKGFFRLVYFLPGVIPGIISLLIWQQIYSAQNGILNSVIQSLGGDPVLWLQDPAIVKWSMVIIMTWGGFGGSMLLYLAALQDVPSELYESAEIDGAGPVQRFWNITIPHIRPLMNILFILQILGVMQIFTEPFILTRGGPVNTTVTPVLAIYNKAFLNAEFGLASAWSVTLMAVLFIFSIIYLRFNWMNSRRERGS